MSIYVMLDASACMCPK